MKNKKTIGVAAIILLIVLIVSIYAIVTAGEEKATENEVESMEEDLSSGDAYNFKLVDTNGNVHMLSDYNGKKVYLKFWATWCPSCLEGLDELGELHEATIDGEIVVLTLVAPGYSGEKSSEKFIEWYEKRELEFIVLLDVGGNSFFEYGIRAVPTSILIDTNGNISDTHIGHMDNDAIFEAFDQIH